MGAIDAEVISRLDHETIEKLAKAQSAVVRRNSPVFQSAKNRATLLSRVGIDFEILVAYGAVSEGARDSVTAYSAIHLAYITTIYPEQFTVAEADALTVAWRSVMGDEGLL